MRTSKAATLESAQGQVVLEQVAIDAAVDDLMTVVDVRQSYRNPGTRHIEVVYTFPLPVEAVLLKFTVEIGDRRMAGTVVAKPEAERRYEDAITDGDAAVAGQKTTQPTWGAGSRHGAAAGTWSRRFRPGPSTHLPNSLRRSPIARCRPCRRSKNSRRSALRTRLSLAFALW